MRICGKGSLFVAALALALSSGLAAAQEPPAPAPRGAAGGPAADEVHAEEHEHANELAVFVGGTTVSDEKHFTIGGGQAPPWRALGPVFRGRARERH